MSKILLINTRPTREGTQLHLDERAKVYFDALGARGPKMGDTRTEPNNGLLIIGNGLRAAGHHVEYLDMSVIEYKRFQETGLFFSREELTELLIKKAEDFDFLFFSSIMVGIDDALTLIDDVKRVYPSKITVLGGTFATLNPEYCLDRCEGLNVLVKGEGEIISGLIIQAYTENAFEVLEKEKGIYYRRDRHSSYIVKEGMNLVDLSLLEKLSIPDWSLLEPSECSHVYRVMTARGCGFRCMFCVPSHMSCHQVRCYPEEVVIHAIKELKYKYKVSNYVIGDLTFLYDEAHSRKILQRIIEEDIRIPFWCQTHLSRVTLENLELLRDAGCRQLAVGIESINPSVLKNINKGIDEARIVEKLLLIKEYGIEAQGYFIIGLPGDDPGTIALNRRFITYGISKGYIERTHIGVYVPYLDVVEDEGHGVRIIDKQLGHYTQGVFSDIPAHPVFETDKLSREEVNEAYLNCLHEVGNMLKTSNKETVPHQQKSIVLGSQAALLACRIRREVEIKQSRGETPVTTVFNLVQGMRADERAFVSSNIQEVGEYIFGNAEIYRADEAELIIEALDGIVDIFLIDIDMKIPASKDIIEKARKGVKVSKVLFYSDIQAWVQSVLSIILFERDYRLVNQSIYILSDNRLSQRLEMMLTDLGAKVSFSDDSENQPGVSEIMNVHDIVVSFGLEGVPLEGTHISYLKEGGLLIDGSIGTVDAGILKICRERGISVFRPDMRTLIISEVTFGLQFQNFRKDSVGRKVIGNISFVSGGVVGEKHDVVVDSVYNPGKIIGIAGGDGTLISQKVFGREEISLLENANLIIEKIKTGDVGDKFQ